MNTVLLRKERLLRMAPLIAGLSALLAGLFVGPEFETFGEHAESGRQPFADPRAIYWTACLSALMALIGFISLLPFSQRVHEYERALPIEVRSVVGARMLATWIALVAPFAAALLVLLLLRGQAVSAPSLALVAGTSIIVIGAALLWAFGCFPSRRELSPLRTFIAISGTALLLALPARVFVPWIALPYAALGCGAYLLLRRPTSYLHGGGDRALETAAADSRSGATKWIDPLRWTLLRSTLLRPMVLVPLLAISIGMGYGGRSSGFMAAWIPLLLTFITSRIGLGALHGLDSLPLPRERVLRYAALPSLIGVVLGFAAWHFVPPLYTILKPFALGVDLQRTIEHTLAGKAEYGVSLQVPPSLWTVTASPAPFTVEAPWGEVHEPTPHPIFWGAALRAVNPYSVSSDSSVSFLTWQVSRALEAVYGLELSGHEVHARWFSEFDPDDAADALPMFRFYEARPWDGLAPGLRYPARDLGFLVLAAILLWLIGMLWVLRPNVPGETRAAWLGQRARDWGLLLMLFVLMFGVSYLDLEDGAIVPVVLATLRAELDGILGGSSLAWIALNLAVLLAGYRLLAWRVVRIDPPPPLKSGWSGKAHPIF